MPMRTSMVTPKMDTTSEAPRGHSVAMMKDHATYMEASKERAAKAKAQAAYGEKGEDMGKGYGSMTKTRDFGLGDRKAHIAKMLKEYGCGGTE